MADVPKVTAKTEKVKPTNCAKCNKPLRKKIWYYRNGKHYCNKTCWRSSAKNTATATPAKSA